MKETEKIVGLVKGLGNIEKFKVVINDSNRIKILKKLQAEREKCLVILRHLKKDGDIKSISLPRNNLVQKELDELVEFKKLATGVIELLKTKYITKRDIYEKLETMEHNK